MAGALFATIVAIGIAYAVGVRAVALLALPTLGYWCWHQRRHWVFYIRGAPPEIVERYGQLFGGNIHIFPVEPGRVVPDAYHTILHILLVADLALTIRSCLQLIA